MTTPPPKILTAVLTFNEGEKLRLLLDRFPHVRSYDLLFVDDGDVFHAQRTAQGWSAPVNVSRSIDVSNAPCMAVWQGALQVAGSMADLENMSSCDKRQYAQNPILPPAQ